MKNLWQQTIARHGKQNPGLSVQHDQGDRKNGDNGTGFDPSSTVEGVGLTSSVRGRLSEVGGTVQIESAPGRGTEILLTIPYSSGGSV